jgi:mannosyltransferase OCH1-like enzyme
MPEYEIKEWNETNSSLDSLYSQTAYAKKLWSKLSNLVRSQALYTEGGIYFDTDVEVIKNFSPLLHDKCFVGFQQEGEAAAWVNNAVIGAEPRHPFLKRYVDLTEEAFEETGEFLLSPVATTMILKEMGLRKYKLQVIKDVTLYPIEYFYPYPWFGKFAQDCIKDNTYCVHHWEGTWLKENAKILRPLRKMRKIARTLISKSQ